MTDKLAVRTGAEVVVRHAPLAAADPDLDEAAQHFIVGSRFGARFDRDPWDEAAQLEAVHAFVLAACLERTRASARACEILSAVFDGSVPAEYLMRSAAQRIRAKVEADEHARRAERLAREGEEYSRQVAAARDAEARELFEERRERDLLNLFGQALDELKRPGPRPAVAQILGRVIVERSAARARYDDQRRVLALREENDVDERRVGLKP